MFSLRQQQFKKFRTFVGSKVWRLLVLSIFVGLIWFLVDLSFVYVLQAFLVSLRLLAPTQVFIPNQLLEIPFFGLLLLITFGFFRAALAVVRSYVIGMLPQEFVLHLRSDLLEKSLNREHFKPTSEILALFSDRTAYAGVVVQHLGMLTTLAVAAFFYICAGLFMAPIEFATGLCLFALTLFPLRILNKRIETAGLGLNVEWRKTLDTLVLGLRNKFLLRLYNLTDKEVVRGTQSLSQYHQSFSHYFLVSSIKNGYPLAVGTSIVAFLTYLGTIHFQTPGLKLISVFYFFLRLAQVSNEASNSMNEIRFHLSSFKELYNFTPKKVHLPSSGTQNNWHEIAQIQTRSISFAYETGLDVFRNLNLSLQKNDILLIQGPSGSGKSTLVLNLVGALIPQSGEVLINEIPTSQIAFSVSSLIGYVGPDPFLIPGTVRENLLYGNLREAITDDEIWNVLAATQSEDFVRKIPQGLNSTLNELTQLSTGQKQRLAFARALLRNPDLLVLDEATANLDPQTEQKIRNLILEISKQRITIIISHKDSFNDLATQTLQMQMLENA